MKARAHYEAGRLDEAIEALGVELRDDPTDVQRRTFLFELLCFAGAYDRAEKQLDVLADTTEDAKVGAWTYRAALHAERTRQEMFRTGALPRGGEPPPPVAGSLNGQAFESLEDADPRIGARLEVFAGGRYTWIPMEHVASVQAEAPQRLRDLIWIHARVRTGPGFRDAELGEVLVPALSPLTWQHPDGAVRLGRVSEWVEEDGEEALAGQKLLLVDGELFPMLEVRHLEITGPAGS